MMSTHTSTHYEIQNAAGAWSAPIGEARLIEYIRDGMISSETRLRTAATETTEAGHEFVVVDNPLLAALLQSLSVSATPTATVVPTVRSSEPTQSEVVM